MDKEKIKLIVRNLELLIDALKSEIYSDIPTSRYDDINPKELEYDEIYGENDD